MTKLGDLFLIPEWTVGEREAAARLLSRIESIALDLGSRIDAQGKMTELRAGSVTLSTSGVSVNIGGNNALTMAQDGITLINDGTQSSRIWFEGTAGARDMSIFANNGILWITNHVAGEPININAAATSASYSMVWHEDPALANRMQLDLAVGGAGTKLTIGGEVEIHGGAGGVTSVFNEVGRDIDFRVEGDTATSLLVADAGLDAVQVGTTVAGAIADFRAATIVFNEASNDVDFRVESNGNANMLFVDGGVDRVGIGASDPGVLFEVRGSASQMRIYNPTNVQFSNDIIEFVALNSTSGAVVYADILTQIRTNTAAAEGGTLAFRTQQAGTLTTSFRVDTGMQVGSPTGGDKGLGTINVAADIYKNNSAYTNPDWLLELWASGKVEKYAERLPQRPAELYDLSEVERFARENYRLPGISDEPMGMFERGDVALEWIERIATYLFDHEKRLEALENA